MEDKTNDNRTENSDSEDFDFKDLISDFSAEDGSEEENAQSDQTDQNTDDMTISEILGDEVPEKPEDSSAEAQGEDEITKIFDDLDDKARESVMIDSADEVKTAQPEEEISGETSTGISFDESGVAVSDEIEDEGDDYASVLSQIEGAGASEETGEPESDVTEMSAEESFEPDLLGDDNEEEISTAEKTPETEITGEFLLDTEEEASVSAEAEGEDTDEVLTAEETPETEITGEFILDTEEEVETVSDTGGGSYEDALTSLDTDDVEVTGESAVVEDEEVQIETDKQTEISGEYAIREDEEADDITGKDSGSQEDALSGFDTGEDEITGESAVTEEESQVETVDETESAESDFSGEDLFAGDEFGEEEPEEAAVAVKEETSEEEDDFLGLGGSGGEPGEGDESRFGATTEVLFEGVEMDFDEQISSVTLAEVLLAQGKEEEAMELLEKVSSQKGTTHWVAKRLNLSTAESVETQVDESMEAQAAESTEIQVDESAETRDEDEED